ncbi:MAG: glycoside hydrolase family 15 protein [Phycisphaerales bacterium]|nr:glycoside hydrolase family 15 protein [Phycisphaerales bacterium]
MPRNLPVGNGEMLVAFDDLYRVRDLYWPHVGMPNHTCGHLQRFGVWADGQFAWIEGSGWSRDLKYVEDSLVTEVRLRNDRLGVELLCRDAVDYWSPVYFRSVTVTDLHDRPRDVRLFFHQDLSIGESAIGDTVNYDPQTGGLIHYKDETYFLFNGCGARSYGVDTWATGQKRIRDAEGTWRDAEDGLLSRNSIAQGSVDSTVGFSLMLHPRGSSTVTYWICAGKDYDVVKALDDKVRNKTPQRMMLRTEAYWRLWATKEGFDFSPLSQEVRDLFIRSELIIRTQIDHDGAIIAANDYDITRFAGDTYSYMWPRDGALVSYALVMAGQSELSQEFFRFASRVVETSGYFLHKYNPTGTIASSWHPWMMDGKRVLPIQQDGTALVVWALRRHFRTFRDVEFIRDLYNPLVVDPCNWMLRFRDHNGLPMPSWDLWEERRGVHLFTVAATIGALRAASEFAHEVGALDRATEFEQGAERMKDAMLRHMWSAERNMFARMATPIADGGYELDFTADASACGLFAFNALDANDPRVVAHMQMLRERLWVHTEIGGMARYERDPYHQVERSDLHRVPGNPWIISTLWYAQWLIARAHTEEELAEAQPLLAWACRRAMPSGVLAEQFDPYSGDHLSVSPLTWSHAAFMTTVSKYLQRHTQITGIAHGVQARA